MKKRLLVVLLAIAMIATFALAGCSNDNGGGSSEPEKQEEPAEEPVAEGNCQVSENANIVVDDYSDVGTFFPADFTQVSEYVRGALVYESLCELDENTELRWTLATGYEVSEDGLEYTFPLRQGITFSDGEPWNAEAAKANFDMIMDDNNSFMGVWMLEPIKACEVVDEYTIKLKLDEPYAPLLNVIASYGGFVSPKLIEKGPTAWKNEVDGTGQYELTDYKSGESMTFELKRDYWGYDPEICGGTPQVAADTGFNSIVIRPVAEEATRLGMLQKGEADVIVSVTPTNKAAVESSGNTFFSELGGMIGYMYFNCGKAPLDDPKVRRAICMAIDTAALNDVVYGGMNAQCDSMISSAINFYVPQGKIEYNVEKAKELLKEAGYENGFELEAWEENDTSDIQRGQFIQQQLEQIGIKVTVFPKEGGILATEVGGFDGDPADQGYDLYIRGWSTDTFDCDEMLGRFTTSAFTPTGSNYSFYSNEEVDKLCAQGAVETDPEKRAEIYAEVQKIMWEELPADPLLVNAKTGAYGPHIENFGFLPNGSLNFKGAKWVE